MPLSLDQIEKTKQTKQTKQTKNAIQKMRNYLNSVPFALKKTQQDPVDVFENKKEIARLKLIQSMNIVLFNLDLKVEKLKRKHLDLLYCLEKVFPEKHGKNNDLSKLRFLEGPQIRGCFTLPLLKDVTLILSGICVVSVLAVLIGMSSSYLAGALSAAAFAEFALSSVIYLGVSAVLALSAWGMSMLENDTAMSTLDAAIEILYADVREYNKCLYLEDYFYEIRKHISEIASASDTVQQAFKKYQDILERDNMPTVQPLTVENDLRKMGFLVVSESAQCTAEWKHLAEIAKSVGSADPAYTQAANDLMQELLTFAYKRYNEKKLNNSNAQNEVFDALKELLDLLPPEVVDHFIQRYDAIKNQKSRGLFDLFSPRIDTVDTLLKEIQAKANEFNTLKDHSFVKT